MKNLLYLLMALISLGFISCHKNGGKECPEVQITAPESEAGQVQQYLDSHNITAIKDKRGFFYTLDQKSSGKHPNACSNVSVGYIGKLTDGSIFDQTEKVSFDLGNLIDGWKEGIPLVGEGGIITLYLPPSLGYGARGSGPVPSNAITIFTITLHKVNN